MRLSLVRSLKDNEILAKNVLSYDGKILLKRGTKITREYISMLIQRSVFFVYVEDELLDDIFEDTHLSNLKELTLQNIPSIFNDVITCNISGVKESMNTINNLIDYIIKQGCVNTNLYEIKNYDNYTYIHCVDTCIMATFLGTNMDYNKTQLRLLGLAAFFHDIGKTKIPSSIINKKDKLTNKEFEQIKLHPFYGKEILSKLDHMPSSVIDGVAQHHEKFDGTGYPFGLKGTEISEFARIISICDVFTAVSANRSYRSRFNPNNAYELILSSSNTHFDKKIVKMFRNTFSVYPLGCCVKLSNGLEGFVVKQNQYFPDRPILRITYDKNKNKITPYEINLLSNTNITIISVV